MPDQTTGQEPVRKRRTNEEAWQEGYEAGLAEGLARNVGPQAPLFEAAKAVVEANADLDEAIVRARLSDIEQERGEELSRSDRELLLGIARRRKAAGQAQQDAVRQLVRPRTRAAREHVETGDIHLS